MEFSNCCSRHDEKAEDPGIYESVETIAVSYDRNQDSMMFETKQKNNTYDTRTMYYHMIDSTSTIFNKK